VSEINNDREIVTKGRKNKLKDVDAPLRDQIVTKLFDTLEEMKITQKVDTLWHQGNASRSAWFQRQSAYLSSWDEHLIESTDGPFDGSSKLHIPMPFIVVKTMHARFMQALWGDPPCYTKARNEASQDQVATVQDTLKYYLSRGANYNKGVCRVVDQWIWDWISRGSGILKLRWDVTYTRFMDVRTVTKKGPPKFQVVNGKEMEIPNPIQKEEEFANTLKTFDGPVFDLVDLEDIRIIGGNGDPDLADAVMQKQSLTASEMWMLADRKVFDMEGVEDVIKSGADKNESSSTGSTLKTQKALNAGRSAATPEEELNRYDIIEAYLKIDVDGSGINSDVVVWIHARTRTLLRATYLHRIMKSGERPYAKADFILRPGQEFGMGMPELLYPLSKELDAMHNMRIDFGLITNMPIGFYRATSGIDPKTIKMEPGMLIPVDNPQTDIFYPNMGNRTTFGMQEEAAIQTMIERLTSISDINLGVIGAQGATRTATGSKMLNNEMSSNLDVYLRRLGEGWTKALSCCLHLLQDRIPVGLSYRITAEDGKDYWKTIKTAKEIAGDYDIEVSSNSATSNPGMAVDQANQIVQATSNPLDIQLGVTTPAQRYEALKNWYQAMGVKDYGRYIQKPQGYERQYTPEEEANRILRGIEVPVDPAGDHQGFIDFWDMHKDDDQLLGHYSPEQAMLLESQSRKHQQMLQSLQQQAAQQANVQQMQANAQMGSQQAPVAGPPSPAQAGGGMPGGPAPGGQPHGP
jgi:hypothetical protein